MDRAYRDIYDVLFHNYFADVPFPLGRRGFVYADPNAFLFLQTVVDEVNTELIRKQQFALRSDAKYLLVVLFSNMIVAPLLARGAVKTEELRQISEADIRLVVLDAAQQKEFGGGDISGHEIISAVDRSWTRFKSTKFQLWGDE